jgi:nucleoside-diphosphate-sugar epimerase
MKKILFMGGTSFFGKLVVKKLIKEKKCHLTLLTRGNIIPPEFNNNVEFIKCDRAEKNSLILHLNNKKFDIVVDNTAKTSSDVKSILSVMKNKFEHYLLCSTGAVYSSGLLNEWEESEANLHSIQGDQSYANNKREAERELLSNGDIQYTIYRPTVVEGPEDPTRRTSYFVQKIYQQKPFYIPEGVFFKHVYSEDAAEIIKKLIFLEPKNTAYNICGNDKISIDAYCNRIANLMHKPPCHRVIPIEKFQIFADNFPNSYGRNLLLSNRRLMKELNFNFTPIDRWLPITIQLSANEKLDKYEFYSFNPFKSAVK